MPTGISIALLAAVLASGKDIVSKYLSFTVDGTVSAFASFLYALPFYLVALFGLWLFGYEDFNFSYSFLGLVVMRAITDSIAEWMKMKAFGCGDISVVSSFISLTPLFLLFTSPLITGDKIPLNGVVAILLIVAGTVLLGTKFEGQSAIAEQKQAVLFSLVSAFFFSLNICFDRLAVHEASPTLSGFGMTFLAAMFIAPGALKNAQRRDELVSNWKPFSLRGAIEFVFMVTKLYALRYLQAPYVAGIMKIGLLFSIVAGKVAFQEKFFKVKLAAGALIASGVAMIIMDQI